MQKSDSLSHEHHRPQIADPSNARQDAHPPMTPNITNVTVEAKS
jgi:hypothetical protein